MKQPLPVDSAQVQENILKTMDYLYLFKDDVSHRKEFATEIIRIEEHMKNPSTNTKKN